MNHPTPDTLWLFIHDALEPEEVRDVRAHLETGCEACAAALAGLERNAGTLALGADPREPDAQVRERLVGRSLGRTAPAVVPASVLGAPMTRSWRVPIPLAAGLVGVGLALGSGATWFGLGLAVVSPQAERVVAAEAAAADARRERDELAVAAASEQRPDPDEALLRERNALLAELAREREATLDARARADELVAINHTLGLTLARFEDRAAEHDAAAALLTAERDSLNLALDAADKALALLESPGVEWVVLSSEDDATQGKARFFWEWDRGDCLIDGGDLPRIAEGQAYALWVAYESDEPALVATFAPDANGSVRLLEQLPKGEGEVRSVRITVEDVLDPTAPEGVTLLAGVLF